jgi:hypothetical protein
LVAALSASGTAAAQDRPEDQYQRNADDLDKVELKQEAEPAFSFKA